MGIIKTTFKIFVFSFIFAIIGLLLANVLWAQDSSTQSQGCKPDSETIIISTPIPGMNLNYNAACQGYEFKGDVSDYIVIIYRFFVGIAGIIAVFMIIFGGAQWLFASGNAAKISGAKETIFGAVIGLVLALGSYTILNIINPGLTNFSAFKERVTEVQIGQEDWYDAQGRCKPVNELPCGAYCKPLDPSLGPEVVGRCRFCVPSADDKELTTNTCGISTKGAASTAKEGNCHYAECPDDSACVYATQGFSALTPGKTFQPYCAGKIKITSNNQSYDYEFNERIGILNSYERLECGQIINERVLRPCSSWQPLSVCSYLGHRLIGTSCDSNKRCVIDISKGYTLTEDINLVPGILTAWKRIGWFLDWKCID